MRRIYLFIVVVFGMATVALAQTTSSDSQTLQALLGEVTSFVKTYRFR